MTKIVSNIATEECYSSQLREFFFKHSKILVEIGAIVENTGNAVVKFSLAIKTSFILINLKEIERTICMKLPNSFNSCSGYEHV